MHRMIFASDNWAGAHPEHRRRPVRQCRRLCTAYGDGDLDRAVDERFSEIFEREVAVFFVATGTAANSLSLTAYNKPGGIAFCPPRSAYHRGRMRRAGIFHRRLAAACRSTARWARSTRTIWNGPSRRFAPEFVHWGRPMAVSITQSTEIGTVYALDEIDAISAIAKQHGLPLHMDGARFANALVALDTTPAEMTWKRGVDILSFGGTKNGCWCAEAIVLFDLDRAKELAFLRKRAAQLFSKSRFIAAQFEAYFKDGLWLDTARHANAMAARLADVLAKSNRVRLAWRPDANEVFAIMPLALMEDLNRRGRPLLPSTNPASFASEVKPDETLCRFVTSYATTQDQIDAFATALAEAN